MKMNFLRLATLATAVSLLALTSCKKEQLVDESMFLATIENQQNKTTIGFDTDGSGYMHWEATDLIAIYGTVSSTTLPVSFTATPDADDASVAIFARTNGDNDEVPEGNDRYAIYPYSIAAGHTTYGTVTLPATQTYSGNRLEAPMWAQSTSDNQLAFKNLCGVLKITQAGNYTVSSIGIKTVGTGEYVCGDFAINSTDASNPQLAYSANGSDTLTLLCNNASSTGSTFFVYLPAQTYTAGMTITLNTNHGKVVHTLNNNLTIARNTCYTVNFAPVGAINGLFSVSGTKKVYFSKGNLQYDKGNDVWSFMEHQWTTVETNGTVADNYGTNGIVSLFCWGTSGWNNNNKWQAAFDSLNSANNSNYNISDYGCDIVDMPYYTGNSYITKNANAYGPRELASSTGYDANYKFASGRFLYFYTHYDLTDNYAEADWCYHNAISNGGNAAHLWRTLTQSEWAYVINTRTDASTKRGEGTVNGVYGLILLPDTFTDPNLNEASTGSFVAQMCQSTNPCNVYNGNNWTQMEARGVVFLPAAGVRQKTTVSQYNAQGQYYSTTHNGVGNAYKLTFTNTSINAAGSAERYMGCSVRAVMDAN